MPRKKDPRPYITVTEEMPDHPKFSCLSDAAFRHIVTLWCYSRRYRLDGVVSDAKARARGAKVLRELTTPAYPDATPLLEDLGDGTWYCHDYLEHQWSAEELDRMAAKNRANGARGGRPRKSGNRSPEPDDDGTEGGAW